MQYCVTIVAGLAIAAPAAGQVTLKPGLEARLRLEDVDQADIPHEAEALALRVRPTLEARRDRWSALIEGEAVVALIDRYNDGLGSRTGYPVVPDPDNVEVNRAQLRYGGEDVTSTIGRQRIALADERFVGTAPWRQSEQTFDAGRIQLGRPQGQGFGLDISHAWSARTVNGRRGSDARPTAISGDNLFALLSYGTRVGAVTGFAYLVDQDDAAVQGYRLSSQTFGIRAAGALPIHQGLILGYAATWARQSDYRRNPNDYAATYGLGEASLTRGGLTATLGYELLGASRGAALTSVQAPLGAAFKFNGWVGKFVTTPPDGVRDLYGSLAWGRKTVGPFDSVIISAGYHRFRSDRIDRPYGEELDLLAAVKHGRYTLAARLGRYRANGFATDTTKTWLQLDCIV